MFAEPRLISTSPHAKGGSLSRQRVLRFLRNTLLERPDTYVTTFFDLYGLTSKFFGVPESSRRSDPIERAKEIEAAFCKEVIRASKCRRDRFLPHIQPYEFESLLFSDVSRFADVEPRWSALTNELQSARQSAESPEHINDGDQTHPSGPPPASHPYVSQGASRNNCFKGNRHLTDSGRMPSLRSVAEALGGAIPAATNVANLWRS